MGQVQFYGKESRNKIFEGVKKVNDAVKVTLGAKGKCVVISNLLEPHYNGNRLPLKVTKDGVTVAKTIKLFEPIEVIGQLAIQEASEKTWEEVGDATTTTCVLMTSILENGIAEIEKGANSQDLKKGIDLAVKDVIDNLKLASIPIGNDIKKIKQIATISANNDEFIGNLIGEAVEKIGKDGSIEIGESQSNQTFIKIADGFKFSSGWLSHYFVTNGKNEAELINPNIVIYDGHLSTLKQVKSILEHTDRTKKPLLLICEDCDMEALSAMIVNKIKGVIKVCVVKCPYRAELKAEFMEDLAIATGATYISQSKGIKIENIQEKHYGNANKVVVTKDITTIIEGTKNEVLFDDYVGGLKTRIAEEENLDEKYRLEKRCATLTGGVAVIYVGGNTETEMKEKIDRVDDAIRSTKAAIAEGYVAGGGSYFAKQSIIYPKSNDVEKGYALLLKSLISPLKQILENSGAKNINDVVRKVSQSGYTIGYNAKTENIEDLEDSGVIDASKVLRCSLQNAASAAGNLLICECAIADTTN